MASLVYERENSVDDRMGVTDDTRDSWPITVHTLLFLSMTVGKNENCGKRIPFFLVQCEKSSLPLRNPNLALSA